MGDQHIPRTDNQDYLGITINTKLSWQPHINKMQNKDRKTLSLIKRTLHAAPRQVEKTAYEVLVRPTLQSATCTWSPQLVLSLVTIGELQVPLPCVLTSCGIHYKLDVASEMPHCFFKIHHGVRISLPTTIVTADAPTRRHRGYKLRNYQPPASSTDTHSMFALFQCGFPSPTVHFNHKLHIFIVHTHIFRLPHLGR